MTKAVRLIEQRLNSVQKRVWTRMSTPARIQEFLDRLPYSAEERYRSPLSVLQDEQGHCFDGALLAAAALRRLGFPPLLVYLTAQRDDDHLLAPYLIGLIG